MNWPRLLVGVGLAVVVVGLPVGYHRWRYVENKRLREVTPGKVYRSGQMTAEGFAAAVDRYRLRTILNAQDEYPDPDIALDPWGRETIKESEMCRRLGVRYVFLPPGLVPRRLAARERPPAYTAFTELLEQPDVYPILIHCKAGLHRTGVLTGVYRLEAEGRTPLEAVRELKANGFGEFAATAANDYLRQYLLPLRPAVRP